MKRVRQTRATHWTAGGWGFKSLSGGDFYFRGQVQTGFWQIQHPIRRETGFLLAGVSDRDVTLNIYIYSVPKDKKHGS